MNVSSEVYKMILYLQSLFETSLTASTSWVNIQGNNIIAA